MFWKQKNSLGDCTETCVFEFKSSLRGKSSLFCLHTGKRNCIHFHHKWVYFISLLHSMSSHLPPGVKCRVGFSVIARFWNVFLTVWISISGTTPKRLCLPLEYHDSEYIIDEGIQNLFPFRWTKEHMLVRRCLVPSNYLATRLTF